MRAMVILLFAVAILAIGLVSVGSVRAQALSSAVWQLTKMPGEEELITASSRYTIQFLPDGTVAIGADCNRATGPWQTNGPTLNITITQSTFARCAADSLAEPFLEALSR